MSARDDSADAFRVAFQAMLTSMGSWVRLTEPSPDIIMAELEKTLVQVRQIREHGEVRPL